MVLLGIPSTTQQMEASLAIRYQFPGKPMLILPSKQLRMRLHLALNGDV